MPRWGEIDFSEYNMVLYNLELISYVPDKLVTIYIILLIPICEVVGVFFSCLAGDFHPNHGLKRTLVTLLRPWIRHCTMIISTSWLRTSSNFTGEEFEEIRRNIEQRKLLSS